MLIYGYNFGKNYMVWQKESCRACTGAPHEERKKNMSRFQRIVTEGNEKADERLCCRKERRCMQHCSMRPASTAWWEEWKDCEELKPKPKEK